MSNWPMKSEESSTLSESNQVVDRLPRIIVNELEIAERFKILRNALEQIGVGMPGASEDALRLAAQDALVKLADREINYI